MGDAILFTICTIVKSEGYAFPGRRVEGNSGKQRGKSDAGRVEREFPSSKRLQGKLKTRGLLNHQFNFIIHRLLHSLLIPFQLNQIHQLSSYNSYLYSLCDSPFRSDSSSHSSSIFFPRPHWCSKFHPHASLVLVLFADGKVQSQPNNDTQEQDHEEADDQQWLLQHHHS